jgi:O-antigen ligase
MERNTGTAKEQGVLRPRERGALRTAAMLVPALALAAGIAVTPYSLIALLVWLGLWAVVDFSVALLLVPLVMFTDGYHVGFVFTTAEGLLLENVTFVNMYLPFFLASFLLRLLRLGRQELLWESYTREAVVLFCLFVLWTFFSYLVTPDTLKAHYEALLHIPTLLAYLLVISTLPRRDLYWLLGGFAFWGTVFALFSLISVAGVALEWDPIVYSDNLSFSLKFTEGRTRAAVMSGAPSTAMHLSLCAWAAFALGLLNWRRLRGRERSVSVFVMRWLPFFAAFCAWVGIMLTRTRSEMVGAFMGGLIFVLVYAWRRNWVLRGWATVFVLLVATYVLAHAPIMDRAIKRLEVSADTAQQASLGMRLDLWKAGFQHLADTRGFGAGTGNTMIYSNQPHAHNVYFSVLFEQGFPGFVLWMLIFLNLLRLLVHQLRRLPPDSGDWMLVLVVAVALMDLSITSVLQCEFTYFLWWVLPALVLAVLNLTFRASPPLGTAEYGLAPEQTPDTRPLQG